MNTFFLRRFRISLFLALSFLHLVLTCLRLLEHGYITMKYPEDELSYGETITDSLINYSIMFLVPSMELIIGFISFIMLYKIWWFKFLKPNKIAIIWGCLAAIYFFVSSIIQRILLLPADYFLCHEHQFFCDTIYMIFIMLLPPIVIGMCLTWVFPHNP